MEFYTSPALIVNSTSTAFQPTMFQRTTTRSFECFCSLHKS